MPFTKETAAEAGRKSGGGRVRWKDKDPETLRNKRMQLSLSQSEYDELKKKAFDRDISMAELVARAVKAYKGK